MDENSIYKTFSPLYEIRVWIFRIFCFFVFFAFTYHIGQNINLIFGSLIFLFLSGILRIEKIEICDDELRFKKMYVFNMVEQTKIFPIIDLTKAESTPITLIDDILSSTTEGLGLKRQLFLHFNDKSFKEIRTFISLGQLAEVANILNNKIRNSA